MVHIYEFTNKQTQIIDANTIRILYCVIQNTRHKDHRCKDIHCRNWSKKCAWSDWDYLETEALVGMISCVIMKSLFLIKS